MTTFDDTVNGWIHQTDQPINLRRAKRSPRDRDLRPARGIAIAALFGADLLLWTWIAVRWFA